VAGNYLAERARTARLLSSEWDAEGFDTYITRISDCGAIGQQMVDDAAADKRLIATNVSDVILMYDIATTNSPELREVMFYQATFGLGIMELVTSLHWTETSGLNILSWPGCPSIFWEDDVESGNNNIYFLNDFSLHVLEEYYQSPSSPFADPSSIQYGVVDYSELRDGSVDGFFDIIAVYLPDLTDFTGETINSIIDALKPGGLLTIRQMAPRNGFYYRTDQIHNYWDHDYSIVLAEHPDLISRHYAWGNGVVFARKKSN